MATATLSAAQIELISSLSQEEIPIKLRCAICSKLAVNAFRVPCCDQAICESCQSTLPSSCPVCEHNPVAAADCKPNKSLRTTIKVFLRTEEKKREALRLKDEKNTPPDTPVQVAAAPEVQPQIEETPVVPEAAVVAAIEAEETLINATEADVPATEAQQDIPQQSIEEVAPGQESIGEADASKTDEVKEDGDEAKDTNDKAMAGGAVSQTPGFGFDASAAGGFPGMPFGGDFNQMQMMMAMQNGMNPAAFGSFPMMGMPGMNMDPMTMQNMFMNGGFGAGMNGMNMGMGVGGFDGGVGSGFNNVWNGQQSWNVGPDNFNHPNASSMGHGDYGSNNSGYAQNAAGYNQGNYGRPNQYNDYQNNYGNQGFRGRGRGRGGFGRGGGYGHGVSNDAFSQQLPHQFGTDQQPVGPVSESGSAKAISKTDANVDEFGREIRATSEAKELVSSKTAEDGDATKEPEVMTAEDGEQNGVTADAGINGDSISMNNENVPMPIQTLDDISGSYQQDYNGNAYGPGRGGYGQGAYYGGRGGFSSMQPPFVKPVDVPINAPTGPKAMREGLPNTSIAYLRRNGYPVSGTEVQRPGTSASASAAPEPSEKDRTERERTLSPSRDRERSRDRSRSKSKERKRSRSRDRHRSHRHRDRSASPTEDDQEIERRREKRREARRRHEEEEATRATEVNGDSKIGEEKITDEPSEERARSASPSESKRSSHRSRRDKDKYRERERDSDREHKSSSHRRRSHRDRSRSRDRDDDRGSDRKRDSGKDRDREKDREHRDRDREHRHRSSHSRRHSVDKAEVKVDESIHEEPVQIKPAIVNGANGTLEIKGASVRHKSTVDEGKIPTGPRGDRINGSANTNASARPQNSRAKGHHESSHRSSHSRHESSNSRSARDQNQSSRRDSQKEPSSSTKLAAPTPPIKDPHELEREARNRERLLKEAQRIAGLTGAFAGRKRSRDDGDEAVTTSGGGSKRNRKKGRRGGAVLDDGESEEARIARLEAEREGARWG